MNVKPLLAKELRLLLPAYAMALLLAIAPVWLLRKDPALALYPFWFGAALLALSSFGREFGLNTFPLILAQPLERTRIWWTKVAVLAGAMTTVFIVWCLSCAACADAGLGRSVWHETLASGGAAVAVAFAGGLWTTLLLRQVAAAFWFTILVPGATAVIIGMCGGTDVMIFGALVLYSVAGCVWAWRQFLRLQEAAWTGGVITFRGWRAPVGASRTSIRTRRPLAAIFWKELQLQQIGLMGIGWLFVLHLGVVAARKTGFHAVGETMHTALQAFGVLWLMMPLLAGGPSVAEERKLGTSEGNLCLPISSRAQFVIKLLFALALGGLLSPALLWTAEGIGSAVGADAGVSALEIPFNGQTLGVLCLFFSALSLIAFYASTLARSLVQALAAGVIMAFGVWLIIASAPSRVTMFGAVLWQGALVYYLGLPTLVGTFLWLGYSNFRRQSESWRLWLRNVLGLMASLALIAGFTVAVYNRAWELITPLEPAHGPARLAAVGPITLDSYGGSGVAAILPDSRLWVDRIGYDPGPLLLAFGEDNGIRVGGKWMSLSGNQMVGGSNWVDAVANLRETVAIRSDGTLWVSEKPRHPWEGNSGEWTDRREPPVEEAAGLVRFGDGTNWQRVVRLGGGDLLSVILLNQEGTLWRWGAQPFAAKTREWPGLRSFEPHRLGTDSDWARIFSANDSVYAWKRDGGAWVIHHPGRELRATELVPEEGIAIERVEGFDTMKWRSQAWCSLTSGWPQHAAVREDGTLWAWNIKPPPESKYGQAPMVGPAVRIGSDADWTAVSGGFGRLAALKADGSLWEWREWGFGHRHEAALEQAIKAPVRLGVHNDWVAIGYAMGGIVSLAADGSLWYWWDRGVDHYDPSTALLRPSRKPAKIENILNQQE